MDNVLNYIFEAYDVMKNKSFWDYIKVFIKDLGVALHFIDSDNTSIQTDRESTGSDRLSYIISMNIDDVFFS